MAKKATTKAAEEVVAAEIKEVAVEAPAPVEAPVEEREKPEEVSNEDTLGVDAPEEDALVDAPELGVPVEEEVLAEAAEIAKEEAPAIEVPEVEVNAEPLAETEAVVKEFVEIKENIEKAMEGENPQQALEAELDKINELEKTLKEDIAKAEKAINPESKKQLRSLFEQGQFGGFWNGLYETDTINL